MKLQMFIVRDIVANVWNVPFTGPSVGHAIRGFEDEVNRPAEDNMLYKHCDDYELFHVGTFDSESGEIEVFDVKVSLMLGRSAKAVASTPALKSVQ